MPCCGSPVLRGEELCYIYHAVRRRAPTPSGGRDVLRCAGHCSTPGGKFDKIVQRQGLGWINFPIRRVKGKGPAGFAGPTEVSMLIKLYEIGHN